MLVWNRWWDGVDGMGCVGMGVYYMECLRSACCVAGVGLYRWTAGCWN